MKAFGFRLETLLHLRELAKDKAIAEYGLSVSQREQAEKTLGEAKDGLRNLRDEIGIRRSVGFSGNDQEVFNRSLELAKERIIDCNATLEEAGRIEVAKRDLYLQADSSYKSLLKLKEKKREEHIEYETKKEEMELEDIIGARFVFNQASSHYS
jgi:flagellar export protein FliJ